MAKRPALDPAAEFRVLLVAIGVGLLLVHDEHSDHSAASSVRRELSV
jgi:hypothetical protein